MKRKNLQKEPQVGIEPTTAPLSVTPLFTVPLSKCPCGGSETSLFRPENTTNPQLKWQRSGNGEFDHPKLNSRLLSGLIWAALAAGALSWGEEQ